MWWLLSGAVIFSRAESALGKQNSRIGGKNIIFNCFKMLAAFLVGLIFAISGGISFHGQTILYSIIYGVLLIVACYAGLKALSCGNMAITSMLASFSLIIPCFVGIVFLQESLSVYGIIGIILVCISIILLNYKKDRQSVSPKCWLYSIITMFANGGCSVIQKLHQRQFPGLYRGEFMLYAMAFALVGFLIISLFSPKEESLKKSDKKVFVFGLLAGAFNCVANFFALYLSAGENATVLFPTLSALNMVGSFVVGRIFFKEKISLIQAVSIVIGITSVVLLKI